VSVYARVARQHGDGGRDRGRGSLEIRRLPDPAPSQDFSPRWRWDGINLARARAVMAGNISENGRGGRGTLLLELRSAPGADWRFTQVNPGIWAIPTGIAPFIRVLSTATARWRLGGGRLSPARPLRPALHRRARFPLRHRRDPGGAREPRSPSRRPAGTRTGLGLPGNRRDQGKSGKRRADGLPLRFASRSPLRPSLRARGRH
jgi:hypothetical protein